MSKQKRSPSTKILCVCVALLFVCTTAFIALCTVNHFLDKLNRTGTENETVAPADEDFEVDGLEDTIDADTLTLDEVEPINDDKLLNVLLIGQDRREGESGRTRSDTMILVSINTDSHKVSVISFMRDLYVLIPGYTANRMNAAYVFGGYDLLSEVILNNFGVHLDGYFMVDFADFISVIDVIGGIDIYLSDEEAEIIGGDAKQGICHLDGKQALAYARIRKIDSDFGRTERQRTVILAIFNDVKSKGLTDIMQLLDTVLPMITTNMSNIDITTYALKFIPYVSSIEVKTYNVPAKGTYASETIRGMSVLVPDLKAIHQLLSEEYLPL